MAKKRYRPRGGSNRSSGSRGNQNKRSGGGGNGGGNRRRRRYYDKDRNENQTAELEPGEEVELSEGVGLLELHPNGYGFLRTIE